MAPQFVITMGQTEDELIAQLKHMNAKLRYKVMVRTGFEGVDGMVSAPCGNPCSDASPPCCSCVCQECNQYMEKVALAAKQSSSPRKFPAVRQDAEGMWPCLLLC